MVPFYTPHQQDTSFLTFGCHSFNVVYHCFLIVHYVQQFIGVLLIGYSYVICQVVLQVFSPFLKLVYLLLFVEFKEFLLYSGY